MQVHKTLGSGFLESLYEKALCLELAEQKIPFETQKELTVLYHDKPIGNFRTDILIHNELIIEIKAVQALIPAHEVQLVNYLTATHTPVGLLLNFGTSSLQFKKKLLNYQPK